MLLEKRWLVPTIAGRLIAASLLFAGAATLAACEEGAFENAGERIDDGVDNAGDNLEDAADDLEDAADDIADRP